MSNRREEAIVIDDSDSETERPAAAAVEAPKRKRPMTRAYAKKARAAGEPTTNADALVQVLSKFPSAELRAYARCPGCDIRDSVDDFLAHLIAQFECLPLTRRDFSVEQVTTLLRETGGPASLKARATSDLVATAAELDRAHFRNPRSNGRSPDLYIAHALTVFESLGQTRTDAMQCPPRMCPYRSVLRLDVGTALVQVPHDVVDIVVSYVDVVQDFIDPPFALELCIAYNNAILRTALHLRQSIGLAETLANSSRSRGDSTRHMVVQNMQHILRMASLLAVNPCFWEELLRANDHVEHTLRIPYCNHTSAFSASARRELVRHGQVVDQEAARLRALGFEVQYEF